MPSMTKPEAYDRPAFTLDDPALSSAADIDAAVMNAGGSSSRNPSGPSRSATEPVLSDTLPIFIRPLTGTVEEVDEDAFRVQRVTSLSEGSMSDRERAFLTPSSALAALKSGRRKVLGRKHSEEGSAVDDVPVQKTAPSPPLTSPTSSSGVASAPAPTDDIPAEPAQKQNPSFDLSGGAHLSDEEKMRRWQKSRQSGGGDEEDEEETRNNGNREKRPGGTLRKRGIRERVLHFTPSWFSVTMGTGVITTLLLLLGQTWPSLARGLKYPALVWSIGSVIIFLSFTAMFTARYILFPQVLPLTIKHSQKSMFLGTPVMGLVTILSGIAQLGTKQFGLGIGCTLAMTGFWWLTAALSLLTSIGIPWSMMTYQDHYFEGTTAALLLPIVPPITVAAVGSTLCDLLMEYGGTQYDTYAWTILCVSYFVLGIGLPLALFVLVLYFQRLLLFKSPPREIIISCMLPLGPCGQGGEACLHLGQVAYALFPRISTPADVSGVPQLFPVGPAMYATGLFAAMALWALGIWWAIIAVATILRERRKGTLPFNMGWWSMTFPVASMAICTARLAITLDSLALKITYTGFVIANVVFWLAVSIPTAKGFWTGELFSAPCIASLPLMKYPSA